VLRLQELGMGLKIWGRSLKPTRFTNNFDRFVSTHYITDFPPPTESQELTPDVVDSVVELFLTLRTISVPNLKLPFLLSGARIISNVFDSESDLLW
jgi:hypothetical protein